MIYNIYNNIYIYIIYTVYDMCDWWLTKKHVCHRGSHHDMCRSFEGNHDSTQVRHRTPTWEVPWMERSALGYFGDVTRTLVVLERWNKRSVCMRFVSTEQSKFGVHKAESETEIIRDNQRYGGKIVVSWTCFRLNLDIVWFKVPFLGWPKTGYYSTVWYTPVWSHKWIINDSLSQRVQPAVSMARSLVKKFGFDRKTSLCMCVMYVYIYIIVLRLVEITTYRYHTYYIYMYIVQINVPSIFL